MQREVRQLHSNRVDPSYCATGLQTKTGLVRKTHSEIIGIPRIGQSLQLLNGASQIMRTIHLAVFNLRKKIMAQIDFVLVTLGGETSYKCCKAIESNELKLTDEVLSAISLCSDINNNWIITKSGNLGNTNTLIEILNYLKHHE